MRKNVVGAVLALLGSAASAQGSAITLSGLLDAYAGSVQPSGSRRVSAVNSGGMSTSWWGLEGREDLGGGLRAEFKLNAYLRNDTGASGRFNGNETFWSRNAFVGLAGDFGSLRLGRDGAPNFLPTALFNAFGDSFAFSPLVIHADVPLYNGTGWDSVNAGDTGWSNQLRYMTPNLDGFVGSLNYQFGEVGSEAAHRNIGAGFVYSRGESGLGGFVHRVRMDNPTAGTVGVVKQGFAQQDAWMLSGKLGLGAAHLYANYEQATNGNLAPGAGELRSRTWSLSADYALGAGKLLAAFARTRWSGDAAVALNGQARGTLSLGYDHALSRRTDVYAVCMGDRITGHERGTSYALGIRQRF
ncbi:porin [Pelomonas sp. KK5]|uniref:porin n=1 Tax=Pelomonas sp. KK5 TaxID=1855730 RepID=UPI00097BFE9B|nr:porin [Pelomonas sp. KK5]